MKITFIKKRSSEFSEVFVPYYDSDRKDFRELHENTVYTAEVKKPRNPRFHRLVFAVADMLVSNAPEGSPWNNSYMFIKACELELGYVDMVQKLNGEVVRVPKSIAFESMAQDEFSKFYEGMVKIAAGILGCSESDITRSIDV